MWFAIRRICFDIDRFYCNADFFIYSFVFIEPTKRTGKRLPAAFVACVFLQIAIGAAAAVLLCLGIAVDLKNVCVAMFFVDAFLAVQEKYFGGITIYASAYGLAVLSSVLGLNETLESTKSEMYFDA